MRKIFLIVGALILVTSLAFLNYNYPNKKTPQVTINNHIFNLEIAKTNNEREIGLAKYKNIPQNFGMLFTFEEPNHHSFWMKNMKFPIDIIFIKDSRVVKIFNGVPAPKYPNSYLPVYKPDKLSDTVLEINAGLSEQYGFKENDIVNINY